jgi:proton glutamate symport protein
LIHSKIGYQAVFAIIFGIAVGLFFGPLCKILKPVGDIFIFSLQIIVLPYIPSLLMHGLGSLSPEMAKKLFKKGWPVLLLLWLIALTVCYIVKMLIPTPLPNPASDFSLESSVALPGMAPTTPTIKFFDIFNNSIPVIALFSVIFGMAIMHLKEKDPLLSLLERVNNSLDRVIKWITHASPIGIFAHIAYVMGTVNFEDLAKLQLYVGLIILVTLILSLWVLPVIVSCLTSIPYRALYQEYKMVGFLPFATAIPTIALPYISNAMRRLADKKFLDLGTFKSTSQTIIPIGFGFAQIGNFLPLLFLFFLSFFYRHPISGFEAFALPFLVTFFSIGTPQFTFVALPYLLRSLSLPVEGFNLYAEISAITLNFQVLLSTVSMLSFVYLVSLRYYGLLQIQWRRLAVHVSCMAVSLLALTLVGKNFIHTSDNYHDLYYSLKMSSVIDSPPEVKVFRERVPPPPTKAPSALGRIRERGVLRVGYDDLAIPFCYWNKSGELVGYDVAYAYQLAKDLEVKLELVPINYTTIVDDVNDGFCDIIMSAIIMDEQRIINIDFTNAYMEQANVLIVPRAQPIAKLDLATLEQDSQLKLGSVGAYQEVAATYFPKSIGVRARPEGLVDHTADAVVWGELQAYIWCLANPDYTTLDFHDQLGKKYLAYPVRYSESQFVRFLNEWLVLKQEQGFELAQRRYWFLGKTYTPANSRWSILHNVLHSRVIGLDTP